MDRQNEASTSPVQEARDAIGLSPEGLASKTGLTLRTIERIEAGEIRRPHRLTREAIARVLRRDPDELFPRNAEPTPA